MMDHDRSAGRSGPVRWQFAESEADGETWLNNSSHLQGYVDYESTDEAGELHWRRALVVTRSWLEAQISGVKGDTNNPGWAALPAMIVLPDAPSEQLRSIVGSVISKGGFEAYSSLIRSPR